MDVPQVEIFKSIYYGSEVAEFLKENNFKLENVHFEKRRIDSWSDDESILVVGSRDSTPEEISKKNKKEEVERKRQLESRKQRFEELKKEFGNNE